MRKSPLFYVGDKSKYVNQIKDFFPKKINNYYEPFLGGGAVGMNIEANSYILSDVDKNVIEIHKFLSKRNSIEKIEKVIQEYGLTVNLSDNSLLMFSDGKKLEEIKKKYPKTYNAHINKSQYVKLREDYNKTKRVELLYVLVIYSFNRILRFNKKDEYNVPVGNLIYNDRVKNALLDYQDFSKSNKISYQVRSFSYLKNIDFQKGDFVYLDPPYLITGAEYNKIWDEEKEEELYDLLIELDKKGVKFMLSNVYSYQGKKNDYLKKLKQFNFTRINTNYINKNDNGKKEIIEVIITNY